MFRAILFILFAMPAISSAATYYVATTGNDSYGCAQAQSLSTPRRTLRAGISCMVGGDTLEIKAGNYAERLSNPPGSSSFANPTRVQRYGSDVVTIQGVELYGSYTAYIIFDGLRINIAPQPYEAVWIDNGAHHIRIVNSEITGSVATAGLGLYGAGHHEIINNWIHNNGDDQQFDHGIYVKSPGNLIQGNEIDHNAASAVSFYNNGSDMGSGNVLNANRIHDNNLGVFAWDLSDAIVMNNAIYNNSSVGISVNRGPNTRVVNNTIVGNGSYAVDISSSSSVTVRNNILYNNGYTIQNGGSNTIVDHNLCNSGCSINANPLFVSSTNFALQSGSPAIDTGASISLVTTDINGASRPQGTAYDIGAYEFGGSSPTPTATPTPPPTSTPTPTSSNYVGCFTDDANRALPVELASSGATVESCTAAAKAAGLTYAGLQYGGWCFGGNTLGYVQVSESECDMPCTADSSQICGGSWRNSIYSTGTSSQPTPTPTPVPLTDTLAPSVSITSPANGTTVVRGEPLTITASATDNVGVSRVEFYVDGSLKCTDSLPSYSCSTKINGRRGDNHTIEVRAYDAKGNIGRHAVTVQTR
jgi:parallel beta-helix repeat protein